jgi:hypothetical protein
MHLKRMVSLACLLIFVTSCTKAVTPTPEITAVPSETAIIEPTQTALATETTIPATDSAATAEVTLSATDAPIAWLDYPIVPEVSDAMKEVYQRGLAAGHEPTRFSKIGDCQNVNSYFLGMFDGGTYRLGDKYAYLQPTIDFFAGSWNRKSLAVHGGLNVAAVLSPTWTPIMEKYTKQEVCKDGESPLMCELRDNNPSFALISMEESWDGSLTIYDTYLRQIVEYTLSLNIVPILATRTELLTQDRQINSLILKIAQDYDVPLWNFGASVANLPDVGIRPGDEFHLTEGKPFFDDPEQMKNAWPWRNLTALQAIDAVSKAVGAQ